MKKVIVVSFQRSGTHFLINNFSTNFAGIQDGWIDIVHEKENQWVKNVNQDNLKEKILEQLVTVYYPHSTNKCLKTHYQAYFFERYIDLILDKYDIFYVIRDPRDVMVACYNYYNNTNYERFVKEPIFSKFLRHELWNTPSEMQPYSYSYVKPRNIVDKWHKHVLSWLPYKDKGVIFIHFSDLKLHPQETLNYIASQSHQQLNNAVRPITVEDKRYRPDFIKAGLERGGLQVWPKYFSDGDLLFLEMIVSNDVRAIAYRENHELT